MKVISIDYETHLINEEYPSPKPVCISAYDGNKESLITGQGEIRTFIRTLLADTTTTIVAHNMTFEALVTLEWYKDLKPLVEEKIQSNQLYCTLVAEKVINNLRKKQKHRLGLDALVMDYFETDISEGKKNPNSWRTRYAELENVPVEQWPLEAKRYAIEDSIWAYRLHESQQRIIESYKTRGFNPDNLRKNISFGVESEIRLNQMAQFGIKVDPSRVEELERELHGYIDPRMEFLEKKGLVTKTIKGSKKNIKEFREYLTKTVPGELLDYTKTKAVSISGQSLTKYMTHTNDEVIKTYMKIVEYEKILTAFVSNLKKSDTIRTQYNAVVSTGRTSSRKSPFYASVNMQQMPREVKGVKWDIRNCFVPRPGYKLVSIDYAGLELASVAHRLYKFYGKSMMRNAINKHETPTDMHSMFAYKVRNLKLKEKIDYELFLANKKKKGYAEYRQLAKPINLGFPGGIGYTAMRGLLFKSGINTKYEVLKTAKSEQYLKYDLKKYKKQYKNLRIERTGKWEYALVYDELVGLKDELFELYPQLKNFLRKSHEQFLTGETIKMKNEFGEWEDEPMYLSLIHI